MVVSGVDFNLLVQTYRTPFFDAYFRFVSFLGNEEAYLLVIPLFYWILHKSFGERLAYLLIITLFLNTFLKNLFDLPRPFQVSDAVVRLLEQDGYGLPSGHAMLSMSLWGYLAWYWRKTWAWVPFVMAFIIASIAFSRIYVGVHFPADVIVGLILGAIIFVLWVNVADVCLAWILHPANNQLFFAFAIISPLLLFFVHPAGLDGYPAEAGATVGGLLLGTNLGLWYENRFIYFDNVGTWQQYLLRYIFGIIVLIICFAGLKVLFELIPVSHFIAMILRFIRYALTAAAVVGAIPFLFVQLGLATQIQNSK